MSRAIEIINDEDLNWIRDDDHGFGGLRTPQGHLPLKRMNVHADISGVFVRTVVEQTFVNNYDTPLEATYIFPLPDRAAVSAFRLTVDGREVVGQLKDRSAARRTYANAIETGHRAAIAEEERPGVFTMRAGNIMPGEAAMVRLEMVGQLETRGDEATFRFPLVVAPRYMPGRPLGDNVGAGVANDTDQVQDASRISPPVLLKGYPNPVHLSLTVDIAPGDLPIRQVRSSLHSVMVDDGGWDDSVEQRIRLVPGERLNRDFVLRLALGAASVGTSLVCTPDHESADKGTFALTIMPPRRDTLVRKPRDIVFVLDRSGSMSGWKMVAARRAVARMIDSLDDADHFSVLTFDNVVETAPGYSKQLVRADAHNRYTFARYLSKVEARGGTQMMTPLRTATHLLSSDLQNDRVIVLVTDGQVGNEGQIVSHFQQRLNGARVFTLGIDRAVNGAFLNRLANLGGGGCELVEDEERLDDMMASIHRRIDTPVWKSLTLAARGIHLDYRQLAPNRMPDVFPGQPVVITGRYEGNARNASIEVRAQEQDDRKLARRVHAKRGVAGLLSKVWARARIRDLEDAYEASGSRYGADEITQLSLKFGVMCRFTSFVAVDRAAVVNPGGNQHQVTQAVEQPDGWGGSNRVRAKSRKAFSMPAPGSAPDSRSRRAPMASAPRDDQAMEREVDERADMSSMNAVADGFEDVPTDSAVAAMYQRAKPPHAGAKRDDGDMKMMSIAEEEDDADFDLMEDADEMGFSDEAPPAAAKPASMPASMPAPESALLGKANAQRGSGTLGRLVEAGKAIFGGTKKEVAEAKTTRADLVHVWTQFTSPTASGKAETLLRLAQLLARLDTADASGFEGFESFELEQLRALAVRIRTLLGRGAAASAKEVEALGQRAAFVLRAVAQQAPIPPEVTPTPTPTPAATSKRGGRGEDFWR